MSELENCCICFEHIEQLYTKWSCNHYFHEDCVKEWHHSCPLCRNTEHIKNFDYDNNYDNPQNNVMSIAGLRKNYDVPRDFRNIYLNLWNKRDCIENNHEILIKSVHGTQVICVNCNLIKIFNRLH